MSKYIDADRLKAEIERRLDKHWEGLPDASSPEDEWTHNELRELGAYNELENLETFIDELQQEQNKGGKQMTRAEEKAWKIYPYETGMKGLICENSRGIYIQGYEQAEKDTIDRAIAWLKEHANEYIVDLTPTYPDAPVNIIVGGMCWEHLRKAMEESE